MKPHDAGLIWLYFLIAGRPQAKRALQSAALALGMTLIACLWVSHVAPHWLPELRSNLATISAAGGINEPGPRSIGVDSPDMIVDLQTVLSIFCDSPRIYNPATYGLCAILLCAWSMVVWRLRAAPRDAWIALAAVAALSMLITYHRSYDVKLFCFCRSPLRRSCGQRAGSAPGSRLSSVRLPRFLAATFTLTALTHFIHHRTPATGGFLAKSQEIVLTRPVPLILLSATIFYLIALWDRAQTRDVGAPHRIER